MALGSLVVCAFVVMIACPSASAKVPDLPLVLVASPMTLIWISEVIFVALNRKNARKILYGDQRKSWFKTPPAAFFLYWRDGFQLQLNRSLLMPYCLLVERRDQCLLWTGNTELELNWTDTGAQLQFSAQLSSVQFMLPVQSGKIGFIVLFTLLTLLTPRIEYLMP